jgi:hypothetical protein
MDNNTYTVEEIGARIRARMTPKERQAVATFGDRDIGERMIQRNPKLQSIVKQEEDTTPQAAPIKKTVPLAEKRKADIQKLESQVFGQTTDGITETPGEKKPGFFERVGSFIKEDIVGGGANRLQDTGSALGAFGKDIFQSTLGSKGLAGVAQMPGKVIGQFGLLPENQKFEESRGGLAEETTKLIELSKTITDPERKAKIDAMIQDNHQTLESMSGQSQFNRSQELTPGKTVGTGINAGLTATTLSGGSLFNQAAVKGVIPKALTMGTESGLYGVGFKAASNLLEGKKPLEGVKEAGLLAFGVGAIIGGLAGAFQSSGQMIQTSKIKPGKSDMADGFKVGNIEKYRLGGSLPTSLRKTSEAIKQRWDALNSMLKGSNAQVDIVGAFDDVVKGLSSNKAETFGENAGIERALTSLGNEVKTVAPNGMADVPSAELIKQGAGTKGAWQFGRIDPDAKAVETVYTKFYSAVRQRLEEVLPPAAKTLNQEMGELIPIRNAIIRRIPIEARNAPVSLTQAIELTASFFDPRILVLLGLNVASKSGRAAQAAQFIGRQIPKVFRPGAAGFLGSQIQEKTKKP